MFVPPPLAPTVEAALRDVAARTPEARAAALEVLATVETDELRARAIEAARTRLDDEAAVVRVAALVALGRLRDDASIDAILAKLERDEDPVVREVALIACAEIGGERALEAVIAALGDPRPEVRFQAVAAIAELSPERAPGHVMSRLDDDDARVRAHAASSLALLGDRPASRDALAARLDDPSAEVRAESALALATLGDDRAIPTLRRLLDDPERGLAAAEALGSLSPKGAARDDLARIARAFLKPLMLKAAASAALARAGDERGVEGLRSVLKALRADGRTYAVVAIGEQRIAALVPEIVALADRPRGADPVAIAETLARFATDSTEARAALERLAARDDEAGARARELLA
ncbi:HEAT repeat domain-containing protein [Sandaracinus amylolyticus]|uniref:HEAT repeat protein n=1 Tax=Sandaracinus amylolyticus TaxID=927083 RepID=A0A0F6YJA8_9BACT|nr:HEAT repeat domain-containing protein [Sandaracinus amylolyticus]AKF06791.1 HEAT repeat protein [Sandaracinus amylolyticus]